ncbi:MAG: hypothetical protein ACK4RK_19145 [Gemmataceae bacterium]
MPNIHGFQGILYIDRTEWSVTPTLLYIGAVRFDDVYSALGMIGLSREFGGQQEGPNFTFLLANATLFAEVTERLTLGLESNLASDLLGNTAILLMPQIHWEFARGFNLQFGVGVRAESTSFIGEGAFRLVYEF